MSTEELKKPIFKKVGISDRKRIFREGAKVQMTMTVKLWQKDRFFDFKILDNEADAFLGCQLLGTDELLPSEKQVVVSFSYNEERYFFHSSLENLANKYRIKCNGDLFVLQRRLNLRFEVPEGYPADFLIEKVNEASFGQNCRLVNVSAGGLRIDVPFVVPALKMGDRLQGYLRLPQIEPLKILTEVRFIKRKPEGQTPGQLVGIQFARRDVEVESYLFEVMTDLKKVNRS